MKLKEIAVSLLIALGIQEVEAVSGKCYGIAFSSGNQQVAFQAGALKALAKALPPAERAYTNVSGVGGGAVNAAILASYSPGQEDQAAARMYDFWSKSGSTALWHNWLPGGVAQGMTTKGGIYNNAATLGFIKSNLADIRPTKRWIDIGITNAIEGRYVEML